MEILRERGLWLDIDPADDPFALEQPALAECAAASIAGVLTVGKRAGQRIIRLRPQWADPGGDDGHPSQDNAFEPQGQTPGYGFSVHAKRRVSAHDKKGLARLVRYITRPMVSNKHLKLLGNGNVSLELKRPFSDGTTHFVFEPLDFLSKLVALVVPPRSHRVRYHGAWARRSRLKELVAPKTVANDDSCTHHGSGANDDDEPDNPARRRKRYDWARLLARVFSIDVTCCPRCQEPMQQVAWIMRPSATRAFLESVGLPGDSPGFSPSRVPTQDDMFDVA